MLTKQKEKILNVLKQRKSAKHYMDQYWFFYEDYLDPTDAFTDFACEDLDGKQGFLDIFPSDIGEESNFSRQPFLIDANGDLVSVEPLFHEGYSVYYCWWD